MLANIRFNQSLGSPNGYSAPICLLNCANQYFLCISTIVRLYLQGLMEILDINCVLQKNPIVICDLL